MKRRWFFPSLLARLIERTEMRWRRKPDFCAPISSEAWPSPYVVAQLATARPRALHAVSPAARQLTHGAASPGCQPAVGMRCRGSCTRHTGVAKPEATIRVLMLLNLLRGSQYAVTSTAATALQLQLTRGDHTRIVRVLSVATSLSSLLEMVATPFIGSVCVSGALGH